MKTFITNKYKAICLLDYFNTHWKITSTTAVIVLLILTFIQTICVQSSHYFLVKNIIISI